jgi:hypothetical protein
VHIATTQSKNRNLSWLWCSWSSFSFQKAKQPACFHRGPAQTTKKTTPRLAYVLLNCRAFLRSEVDRVDCMIPWFVSRGRSFEFLWADLVIQKIWGRASRLRLIRVGKIKIMSEGRHSTQSRTFAKNITLYNFWLRWSLSQPWIHTDTVSKLTWRYWWARDRNCCYMHWNSTKEDAGFTQKGGRTLSAIKSNFHDQNWMLMMCIRIPHQRLNKDLARLQRFHC